MKTDDPVLMPLLAGAIRAVLAEERPGVPGRPGVGGLDWPALLALARHHQLAPLLARGLREQGIACPEEVQAELRQAIRVAEVRAERASRQLQGVLAHFEAAGITPLVLKGAALAYSGYPTPGLRSFSDLDLLVRPSDRAEAAALLRKAGYAPLGGHSDWWSEHHHHWVFTRAGALPVELHWDLTPPASPVRLPLERLWEAARPFSLYPAARVLAPEDELLHLAVHAGKHRLRVPLRVFADALALLAGAEPCDFRRLEQSARAAGALTDLQVLFGVGRALGFLGNEAPRASVLTAGPNQAEREALAAYMVAAPFAEWAPAVVEGLAAGRGWLPELLRRLLRPRSGASDCRSVLGETASAAPTATGGWDRARRAFAAVPALLRPSTPLRGAAAAQRLFADREAP